MIYNYFQVAFRSLLKNKVPTFINIFGLAFGIASVFLIGLYIYGELQYDRFHHDAESLYRVTWEGENPQTRTPHPMAQALANDFPEVESAVSLSPLYAAGLTRETHSLRNPEKDERYDEQNVLAVDTTFFKVFDFKLVKGNRETALQSVDGILISQSLAKKYFCDQDPIGKHLAVDSDEYLIEVVGVFEDVPVHSHFHFDILVSYLREKSFDPNDPFYSWQDFGHYNYIRLRPGTDAKALEGKLLDWARKYIDVTDEQYRYVVAHNYGFRLQKVTDIHLQSRLRWELEPNGNIEYIYILGAAGLLTLIIACVNFMNLTTARSAERAREIGVRKTLGAGRPQLSSQFLAESVIVALLSVVLAVLVLEATIPLFNLTTGLSLKLDYRSHLIWLIGLGVTIGIISGLYPSVYLSSIKPHLILKGKMVQTPRGARLRNSLVVFQFAISMMLISAAAIIFNQLQYLQNKNLGFDKEEVIVIHVKNEDGMENFETFKNELLNIDGVTSVSASSNIPGKQFNQHDISSVLNPDHQIGASEAFVDYDFFKTLNIPVNEGRTFLRENASDTAGALVINETTARQLLLKGSPVGQEVNWERDGYSIQGKIIGVVKDFHFQSLHEPIRPLVFALSHHAYNYIVVKLETDNFNRTIEKIEKTYKTVEPIFGFDFAFMEDQLNTQYASEKRTAGILTIFSGIAIAIACFGLFGISMLTFHQKIKEVSVRKVLGATAINLLLLMLGGFTRLIVVAIVIAIPAAWWLMDRWLDNFSYQVSINPAVFIVSALALIVVSWLTLS
jgi:putative ABC transport system permease protein